jgi:hypothetical protein
MKVNLIQHLKFRVKSVMDHTKRDNRNVVSVEYVNGRVEARSNGNWADGFLVIPAVCPSTIENALGSSIIKISYMLEFAYDIDGPYFGKKVSMPITIGTVPLMTQSRLEMSPLDDIPQFSYKASIFDSKNNDLPPSYDEIFKGEIIESDLEEFKPHYPYYNNF